MLKEFDLDAPLQPKDDRHRFRLETRCVTALYERCFRSKQKTGKIWKLMVEAVPKVNRPRGRDLIGVLTIECAFDVAEFFTLDAARKKQAALGLLDAGVEALFKERTDWEAGPFHMASESVRRLNFVNEWLWGKPFKNPDSTAVVEVLCQHDVDAFTITFRMKKSRDDAPKLSRVVSVAPSEFIFSNLLGRGQWQGKVFRLFDRNGTVVGEINEDQPLNITEKAGPAKVP